MLAKRSGTNVAQRTTNRGRGYLAKLLAVGGACKKPLKALKIERACDSSVFSTESDHDLFLRPLYPAARERGEGVGGGGGGRRETTNIFCCCSLLNTLRITPQLCTDKGIPQSKHGA